MQHAVSLFVDIVDSASIGNNLATDDYSRLLQEFRKACCEGVAFYAEGLPELRKRMKDGLLRVQGDEFLAILPAGVPLDQVFDAVSIAHQVKLEWLFSPTNMRRLSEGKRPIELAVGIHRGPVQLRQVRQPLSKSAERCFEGFSISIAKRVETHSRHGHHSKILVTEPVYRVFEGRPHVASFKYFGMADFKGIAQSHALWELLTHSEYAKAQYFAYWGRKEGRSVKSTLARLRSAAAGEPENAWLASILMAAEGGEENWLEVLELADRILSRHDSLQQPREWRIQALVELKAWERALHDIEILFDQSPVPGRQYNRVICLLKLDRHDEALSAVEGLERHVGRGEYCVTRYYRAVILIRGNRRSRALAKLMAGFSRSCAKDEKSGLAGILAEDEFEIMPLLAGVPGADELDRMISRWLR